MKWEKKEIPPELVKSISSKYGCDLLTASILARRGHTSAGEIRYFLEDDPRHLRNPFELPGMEDAVERILAAKEEGEKVLVSGDRDVDGVTGTALLAGYLRSLGMDVTVRLPAGDETYGLSLSRVEEFAAAYGSLIITVDCGISNFEEVKRAGELGVDVVITDHHNPQETLPQALTIVNPKLPGYPFRDLAGCGVAYKLVSALRFALKSELYGQSLCLLNTRPVNDSWVIEIAKLRNLAVVDRLTETVVPGAVGIGETRLPAFLEGQQILAWDAALQKRALAQIFGNGVEIYMRDISEEIGKEIPSAAGKTLLRIKELSRLARYQDGQAGDSGEIGVFVNLFSSFIRQREKLFTEADKEDLQLVCLGTVADVMPLMDENRILVRQGLLSLMEKPRPGVSELLFKLDLAGKRIRAADISWTLGPTVNSAGRMGSPQTAFDLLTETDPLERERLTDELMGMNKERKKLGEEIWLEIEPLAAANLHIYGDKLALAYGPSIPRGVTGIMANRLLRRFNVPSLVASLGDKVFTGSLRSSRGYDLHRLLEPCDDLLLDWGGHDYAAGFSVEEGNWDALLERLKAGAPEISLEEEEDAEILPIDAELPLSYLNPEILKVIDGFEPYGEGNEQLTFMVRKTRIVELSLMGKNGARHVKLLLDAGPHKWPAVYWNAADRVKRDFDQGDMVDAAFRIDRNWFKGNETPQIIVSDMRRSSEE